MKTAIAGLLMIASVWVAMIYIAVHFIMKFW